MLRCARVGLRRGLSAAPLLLLSLLLATGCLPPEVKQLNNLGDKAAAERKYERAVSYYSQSLALAPDQDRIRLRMEAAKVFLRQIYVNRIYELIDEPRVPIGEYLSVWRMLAALPAVQVEAVRVAEIRVDLSRRFVKVEPELRAKTEPHNYYLHLGQMQGLAPDGAIQRTLTEIGGVLQQQHVTERDRAERAKRPGLALLHATAAAVFAPRETGLFADADRRRRALLEQLAIGIGIKVSASSAAEGEHLLGGLRRRLPSIFASRTDAPYQLVLRARRPESSQQQSRDQLSARCQTGTASEPNPECESLKNRAESAKRTLESQRRALDAAAASCATVAQPSSCQSSIASERGRLNDAQHAYDGLERSVGSCPRTIEKPIFKVFFYERFTVSRQASAVGDLTLTRAGQPLSSRPVRGSASAQDTYGDGLGCAGISSDTLQLDSPASLIAAAQDRMLESCLGELLQIRRRTAEQQLAGSEQREDRLDALVRARLVDDSYRLAREQLQRQLAGSWSHDFGLPDRILR
jgi:hypothetical protein